MKKVTKIVAMVLTTIATVSCSDTKTNVEQPPMQLTLQGMPMSRYDGDYFDLGDAVGVYVVKRTTVGSNELLSNGNYTDNTKFIYKQIKIGNSSTTYFLPEEGKEVFWALSDRFNIYSYYPYMENITDPLTDIQVTANTDQTDNIKFALSDFLVAKSVNVTPTIDPVEIQYKHLCSQILVRVIPGDGYTSDDVRDLTTGVVLKNIVLNAKVNIAAGTIVTGTELGSINMYRYGNGSSEGVRFGAIFPPQQISNNNTFIELNIAGKVVPFKTNMIIESGKSYEILLIVDKDVSKAKLVFRSLVNWDSVNGFTETIKVINPIHENIKRYCKVVFIRDYLPFACLDGATIGAFTCEPGGSYDYFDYAHRLNKGADITDGMEMEVRLKSIDLAANSDNVCVHVDWNNDGDFIDANESIGLKNVIQGEVDNIQKLIYTLTIPSGAKSPTTMRISGWSEHGVGCGKFAATVYDVPIYF